MNSYLGNSSIINIFFLFFLTLECKKLIFSRAFSLESKNLLSPLVLGTPVKKIQNEEIPIALKLSYWLNK